MRSLWNQLATRALAVAFLLIALPSNLRSQPPTVLPHEQNLPKNGLRDFALVGTASQAASQTPQVRMVYVVPSDRQFQPAYAAAIERAITNLQIFYRNQMGNGTTFTLHNPVVEVLNASQPASYYSTDIWNRTLADGFRLMGAGFNDPNNRWVFMVDSDPDCKTGGGYGGTSGVALLPKNDLRGEAGIASVDVCSGQIPLPQDWLCRWVGGLGHELGHAFGLPHPPACERNIPGQTCPPNALMWTGLYNYPDTVLLPENRTLLASTGFFQPLALTSELPSCRSAALPNGPTLAVSPASLMFTYNGGAAPISQTVNITSSSTSFLVAPSTSGWLSVTPLRASTPVQAQVIVNPVGLPPGTYQGYVDIITAGAANGSQRVNVSFVVNAAAAVLGFVGRWRDPKSQIINISQTGNAVALQYYNGATLSGTAQGDSGLSVNFSTGCCTGAVLSDGSRIDWSDGTSWYKPYLGRWTDMVNETIAVNQSGNTLTLQFNTGRTASGTSQGDSSLNVAFSLGCCAGTVTPDGKQINWSNGTTWTFLRVLSSVTGLGIVTTVAGNGQAGFGGDDGAAVRASLNGPQRVALDSAGNLFIVDRENNRIRKVTPKGTISTFAGNGAAEFSGDGGPAPSAGLNSPGGVYADASGNVFIADFANNRIRKVTMNGTISTVAGTGQSGFSGDGGPATSAVFAGPNDITGDRSGNLYVIDFKNLRLRKIGSDGIVNSVTGGQAPPREGAPALTANLGGLFGVTLDPEGNIYLATGLLQIVEITTVGTVHFTGIGLNLNNVFGVATDQAGNLYIADPNTNQIARFSTASNTFAYIAGGASAGFSGDGGPSSAATFNQPLGLAIDPQGAVYVVDYGNQRVRKITPPPVVSTQGIVNAASFQSGAIAADEFISLFGTGFSARIVSASAFPSPEPLGGVSVKLKDSSGTEIAAPPLFVAPGQITCLVPEGLKTGPVTVTVTAADGQSSAASLILSSVSPGVFSANATGKGVAAANAVRVGADGTQTPEPVFQCASGSCTAVAIDLGQATDQTYLTLFGTGIRGRSDLSDVAVQIGGQPATVLFAGAQGTFPGLDQVNVLIPQSLSGAEQGDIVLRVGNQTANTVTISIK